MQRDSNIEMLRNLAMFLVLVVHSMYFSLGPPSLKYALQNPLDTKTIIFIECLAIVCVNLFILISGWFGIRPKTKSVLNLFFQWFFLYTLIYAFCLMIGISKFSINGIKQCLGLAYLPWFVPAYLGLYLLSPILNSFIENSSQKIFYNVLILFFAFEFFYGCFLDKPIIFDRGYSVLSFVGLYLLARYVRLYKPKFSTLNKYADLSIYFGITIFAAACMYHTNFSDTSKFLYYNSPTVVTAALFLFLFFTKISFQSKFVNWCAVSSFAVYLIHTNPNLVLHFNSFIKNLHETNGYFAFHLYNFLFLVAVFFGSILVDKIRIFFWNKVEKVVFK